MKTMTNEIEKYVASISDDGRQDMAIGRWDEVMTDALYRACGANTIEEMILARQSAETWAKRMAQ